MNIDELVLKLQTNNDSKLFKELFSNCHRELLKFLLSKKIQLDDAEDLLQDYFVNDFSVAIKSFDSNRGKKFINYIKRIILLRYINFQKRNTHSTSEMNENMLSTEEKNSEVVSYKILTDEIKAFFRDLVNKIENENHKNAFILKLCLPIRLTNSEIAELLNCNENTFMSWLFRAVIELKSLVENNKKMYSIELEDILEFLKHDNLYLKHQALDEIKDSSIKNIVDLFIYQQKDIKTLSKQLNLTDLQVKDSLRHGIFVLLKEDVKQKYLFRGRKGI